MIIDTEIVNVNGEYYTKVYMKAGGPLVVQSRYRVKKMDGTWEHEYSAGPGKNPTASFILESDNGKTLIQQYPNSRNISFVVEHWQDKLFSGWELTDTKTVTVSIQANSYTRPKFSQLQIMNEQKYYIKGVSFIEGTVLGAGRWGADVTKYQLLYDGTSSVVDESGWATIKGNPFIITGYQNVTFVIRDTRGIENSVTKTVWVVDGVPEIRNVNGGIELDQSFPFVYVSPCQEAYMRALVYDEDGTLLLTKNLGRGNSGETEATLYVDIDTRKTLYEKYTNTRDIPLTFILQTFSDSTYKSKVMDDVQYSINPIFLVEDSSITCPEITIDSINPTPNDVTGTEYYIEGKSQVDAKFSAKGKCGADIVKTYYTVDSKGEYEPDKHSHTLERSGKVEIRIEAWDSRNLYTIKRQYIFVKEYNLPAITPIAEGEEIVVKRCDENGFINEEKGGEYLKIQCRITMTGIGDNVCNLTARLKSVNSGTWGENILLWQTTSNEEYDKIAFNINDNRNPIKLDADDVYFVELTASDSFNESTTLKFLLSSGKVFMDRRGEAGSIAFGGYSTRDNAFEVNQNSYFYGGLHIAVEGNIYQITVNKSTNTLEIKQIE